MLTGVKNKLFGSRRRTEVLLLIALLEESYPCELARLLKSPLFSVQKIVNNLDREGVVATRLIGRERRVALDPRFLAYGELRELLLRLAAREPSLTDVAASVRRRPRKRSSLS